jgi:hypothetical protein
VPLAVEVLIQWTISFTCTFADFCPKHEFFAGFYLFVVNIAGRICKAAMGGAEVAQRPVFSVKDPKKTGAHRRTRGAKNHLCKHIRIFMKLV